MRLVGIRTCFRIVQSYQKQCDMIEMPQLSNKEESEGERFRWRLRSGFDSMRYDSEFQRTEIVEGNNS